jgi:hypothetical protein
VVAWANEQAALLRNSIERRIRKTPSLKTSRSDNDGWADAWDDAVAAASKETGKAYTEFPNTCPWIADEVLNQAFFPCIDQAPTNTTGG